MDAPALTGGKGHGSRPDRRLPAADSQPGEPLGGLEDILGFHIRLAHGAVYRHFTETFADLDLTQKQVSALWLVAERPGISQVELGRRLRMDRATTMTIVNRLQQRGYLRRERSTSDGRKQALFASAAGSAALEAAKRCIAEHEAWLKSRFTVHEAEKLVEMLARIHE